MSDNRTILLVDDVEMFRELGALFLARAGRVITAESGLEGLEVARQEKPDLMLVDLLMPGLHGDDVCRIVKSDPELQEIPVIMLVGDDAPTEWGRAVRAGADEVMSKPISRSSLNQTVNRFLRSDLPKGTQRVHMNAPIKIDFDSHTERGKMRNLSRGGVFIETDCRLQEETEIGLSFVLPESGSEITPTAQVIWQRRDEVIPESNGIGVRFVDISGESIRTLEDYVFDRAIDQREQPLGV